MEAIAEQIKVVRNELDELESTLDGWDHDAGSLTGFKRYRSISKRIVESAKRLEGLVKVQRALSR
jgi:hypothetical protein